MTDLSPIDQLEVVVLADNAIDYSSSLERPDVQRPRQWSDKDPMTLYHVWASHGFSALVTTRQGNETNTTLYDTGESGAILEHNTELLGIDFRNVESIMISHGHSDHMGGLLYVLRNIERKEIPVHLHPNAFGKRGVQMKDGKMREFDSVPTEEEIRKCGGNVQASTTAVSLHDGSLLLSGEIPRTTGYERGFEGHRKLKDGDWMDDSLVLDDRFLVAHVKEKGLVIVTGCSHAGIVNIVRHAVDLTGIEEIYGIIGGFHLVGKTNERRIDKTVRDLKMFNPRLLVPAHCTGWRAQRAIAAAMPKVYVNGSVGNLYRI